MSYPTVQGRAVEGLTYREAQVCLGPAFAQSYYLFSLSGTNTAANVYQNGTLSTPFPIQGHVTADNFGRFPPIYLDTSIIYRVRFFDKTNTQRWQQDPYVSQLSTVGTSSLSAYGFSIATTGEVTVPVPNSGGTGLTLTVKAGALGSAALRLNGTLPGNSNLIINSSATTGANTATFQANNLPGTPATSYSMSLSLAPSGGAYTGGTLNTPFTGATSNNYTVQLSTGQDIYGATLTNGSTALATPPTSITGTPTANIIISTPVPPAGWLPITCDGVQYYAPIWHGNSFSPYVANPSPLGEVINASSVLFGGNGLTTATNGTAAPGNWFSPSVAGVGSTYDIQITKTSGLSAVVFSIGSTQTNITSGGLTVTSNAQSPITGTYNLLLHGGSTVVASGTITLQNNNGVQSPTYNGATPINLAGNGTATLNGVGAGVSNWFAPTTSNVGASYWINITQTGGTAGYSFSAASGAWTNITNGGLTIGISGSGGSPFFVTGTYVIASDSGGVNQLGSGTITLNGGGVQSSSWSGTTPLNLAGNGTATLNGVTASPWFSPTTANTGAGYWIDITRTGGTAGVNFTAAQGSWTNITNSGLTIDINGYSGDVGTVTASGTYQISSSSSGTPVLGSGTISLSLSGLTVIHTYTGQASGTEIVPTGSSNCKIEAYGGGAGGGFGTLGTQPGGGGGAYVLLNIAVVGGNTMPYSVAGGANGSVVLNTNGASAAATTVSGTVSGGTVAISAGGGQGNGTGGAASGGSTNTAGGTGNTSASGAGAGPLGGAATTNGNGLPAFGNNYGGGGGASHSGGGQGGGAGYLIFTYT